MHNISFMDSSGLGACIALHKMVNEKEGMLICSRPSENVAKVFKVTRADKKLSVANNKNDGIKALTQKLVEARSA
jgi:anti-anti-sigma factor